MLKRAKFTHIFFKQKHHMMIIKCVQWLGYRLDEQENWLQFPGAEKRFRSSPKCSDQTGADPAAKWADCEADHSPLSRAEFKNSWSNTSTPKNTFMAQFLIKRRDFTCTVQTLMYWCTQEHLKLPNVIPSQQSSQQIHSSVTAWALAWSMTCSNHSFIWTQLSYFALHYSVNFLTQKFHTCIQMHIHRSNFKFCLMFSYK